MIYVHGGINVRGYLVPDSIFTDLYTPAHFFYWFGGVWGSRSVFLVPIFHVGSFYY